MKHMLEEYLIKKIAEIHTDFPSKFGIPRQSGLADQLKATIQFEEEYRDVNAVRGIEQYSHLWLIWQFSQSIQSKWSPTVKPPRLGGNERMGVFATRSPFRPNALGLSCVKLESVEFSKEHGPILHVSGADLLDGTPIYDIKPYLKYVDSKEEANSGFADAYQAYHLEVECNEEILSVVPVAKRAALLQVLSQDPRPSYQNNPERIYGMEFADYEVKFTVSEQTLTIESIETRTGGTHTVKYKSK